ncbi:uncharacterized protein TA08555 [Theileria annulata]|uniref:PH domain-containing protein n=1 Tax=Theileria annulata TaxID=5874 RepID=Q4UAJ1_THEAN|nr:uncharacterized protein TA08555 [Theileria annulata]CAI76160.1 hypothetical protein, conserved [Theileria annulata]|eukprot:XP_952786.1 hypothetical protein, conserved [Theileria annulata]
MLIFLFIKFILCNKLINDIPICGNGYSGLLEYKFNNDDDSLITIASYLSNNILNLYTGNVIYKRIDLNECILPIETINNKCFSIRSNNNLPNIFCSNNLLERNKWINAINSSILCQLTSIRSKLPIIGGNELFETLNDNEHGINLFIHDDINGRPEIYINGKTTKELQEEREKESLNFTTNPIQVDNDAMNEAKIESGLNTSIPHHGYYHYQHI